MSMRKRAGGTIIDAAMERKGWDRSTDPGSLLVKMPEPKQPPICHCAPQQKARLGGMRPKIDLDAGVIRCATCMKEVGPACRTRAVTHLRGLLTLRDTKPEHFDLEDSRAAGFLL